MEHVEWTASRPPLRTPVMVAAFTGWNDAGDAASLAVAHLVDAWDAHKVATLDPEEFYDFQQTRPTVHLDEGFSRRIEWPANDMYAASTPAGDLVLLRGVEPQLRWRTFCDEVLGVAAELGVRMVVTLGALLADVAHSRPVPLIGTGTDDELIDRFGLQRSRYEGPTGIVGVLHDACQQRSLPSVSLWAAVPAYAPGTSSPKAALALVRRVAGIVGSPVDTGSLERASIAYVAEVSEQVSEDEDLAGYVQTLEHNADDEADEDDTGEAGGITEHDEGSAERLVEEVERYLRDQGLDG